MISSFITLGLETEIHAPSEKFLLYPYFTERVGLALVQAKFMVTHTAVRSSLMTLLYEHARGTSHAQCMSTCTRTYTHTTYTHTYVYTHTRTHASAHMHAHTHTHTHTHTHIHTRTHTHTHACTHTCMHTCTHTYSM